VTAFVVVGLIALAVLSVARLLFSWLSSIAD
jgi:hypothetical protein